MCVYSSNDKYGSGISCETPLSVRERGHRLDYLIRKQETQMRSAVAPEKRARANNIPATLVAVYNTSHIHIIKAYNTIFEPRHEISNNVVCATSNGSDQPVHTRSLIRDFASRLNIL